MAACGFNQNENCDDCVQVVRNMKTVQVPCTRNRYKKYTVKVPRQVTEQVPRTVQYTDFESRQKQVPYTDYRSERRTRMESQKYQVPVTTTHTKMVPVTKKVPKTVYVNVTTQVPKSYTKTTMQTKERQVPVPYYVNVPETKYHTVTEQVPVQKSKVQMDSVVKTVYDTQVRTRCVPVTKIVTKQIPVFNVVAKAAPAIPLGVGNGSLTGSGEAISSGVVASGGGAVAGAGAVTSDFNSIDNGWNGHLSYNEVAFDIADSNKNGQLQFGEYKNAQSLVNLTNAASFGGTNGNTNSYGNATGNYGESANIEYNSRGVAYPANNSSPFCTSCEIN